MNYYKRHIGDYAKKAGHLTTLEHGVYTLLLDAYYDREIGPTKAEALRQARARTPEEVSAVEAVLADFFTLDGDRYIQKRVEEEFALAAEHARKNAENGKRGGRPRKANGNPTKTQSVSYGNPGESEKNPNPLIHQSTNPLIQNQEQEQGASAPPPKSRKRSETTIADWLATVEGDAIPADDPVFDYAAKVGIPPGFLLLAWTEFEARHLESGKRYKDWRAAFRKCVRDNWYRLWWVDPKTGDYALTTQGVQAQRAAA